MNQTNTELRRQANRRNAKKSTGPRTPGGKARSSRNALTHGLLANNVVLTAEKFTENRADFDRLLADLVAEIRPAGLVEQTLVERIATCYWRLHRAQRFEVGSLRENIEAPDDSADRVDRLRCKLQTEQEELEEVHSLLALLDKPADQLTAEESGTIEKAIDLRIFQMRNNLIPYVDRPSARTNLHEYTTECIEIHENEIEVLESEIKCAVRDHKLRTSRRALTTALPETGDLLKVIRYETMLDRQIHRALAELRRLRSVPRRGMSKKNHEKNVHAKRSQT